MLHDSIIIMLKELHVLLALLRGYEHVNGSSFMK